MVELIEEKDENNFKDYYSLSWNLLNRRNGLSPSKNFLIHLKPNVSKNNN